MLGRSDTGESVLKTVAKYKKKQDFAVLLFAGIFHLVSYNFFLFCIFKNCKEVSLCYKYKDFEISYTIIKTP
jgi:hypothetical protein